MNEFFVYKTEDMLNTWAENPNTMVHIACTDTTLTVVVDNSKDPAMASFLDELRGMLRVAIGWNGPFR